VRARLRTLEGAAALLLVGVAYALVSARFTIGPPWLVLAIVAAGSAVVAVLHWRGRFRERRIVSVSLMVVATTAVGVSAAIVLGALLSGREQAGNLLLSAALLWVGNILVFSLWYWELDAGGPHLRQSGPNASTDFLFPQMASTGDRTEGWCPEFFDYLFLAFNTSTAFSPTDTMVLARRAKVLMMLQSLISLVTIAVLAARAINTL
jgi:hypothetical protein